MSTDRNIDAYRIGILYALWFDWRALTISRRKPAATINEIGHLIRLAKARKWRTFRQQFDGWHAEHRYAAANAGTGWTRERAVAHLRRNLAAAAAQHGPGRGETGQP